MAEAGFSTTRRGFNQGEVKAFLSSVAAELGRLQERQRQLEAELHSARTVAPSAVELDEETVAKLLGEETLRVLQTARESASEIKIRAEDNAARIMREAHDEANRVRQETEVETARKRYDASADAEAEVALAKQQGREMVNEARAYRERVLADLERRTTLARKQIEELLHGRDRLLQVFERARLVAVDVTSELQAIDSPDELVNLSPTTGPVPLMLPTDRVPRRQPNTGQSETGQSETGDAETDDAVDDSHGDPSAELIDLIDAAVAADEETVADDQATGDGPPHDEQATPDDIAAGDQVADPERPNGARDANVVSLFRGRATSVDDADEDGDSDGDGDGDLRPDVGGIFARLRSESPAAEVEPDDEPETEPESKVAAAVQADDNDEDDPIDLVAEPSAFSRRDEAIVPLIVGGARKIKRSLADEQNGVLDTLRQNKAVTTLDDLLPEIGEHLAVYVAVLEDDLIGAAAAGAGELGINDTKTLRRRLAKTGALEAAHDLLRTDLLRPLRDRLDRAINEGSGDNDDITKRARSVYREWKTQHIDEQLDDLFRFAHGGGLTVSVEPGTPLAWTIDPGHPACPDCEDNSLAGSVAAGEAFPTGHTAAPAHPGCRCLTLPAG